MQLKPTKKRLKKMQLYGVHLNVSVFLSRTKLMSQKSSSTIMKRFKDWTSKLQKRAVSIRFQTISSFQSKLAFLINFSQLPASMQLNKNFSP